MHRELACAAIVALTFAVPVRADLYEAIQAYKKGEHATAFEEFFVSSPSSSEIPSVPAR